MEWPRITVKPGNTKLRALFRIAYGQHGLFEDFSRRLRQTYVKVEWLITWLVGRNEISIITSTLSSDDLYAITPREMTVDYSSDLLRNVHRDIPAPEGGQSFLVRGDYEYWHYGCDGFNDKGWGCGYRTLQTICSWVVRNRKLNQSVPNIRHIQEVLVTLDDKEQSFIGSRDWIGSFEVCLVLNHLYEVLSKIVHVRNGRGLQDQVPIIRGHFEEFGSPVMMGGDKDCSSKCVVGIHEGPRNTYLLIVDPHFVGRAYGTKQLENHRWVKWQCLDDFIDNSFYNLCLPQIKFMSGNNK